MAHQQRQRPYPWYRGKSVPDPASHAHGCGRLLRRLGVEEGDLQPALAVGAGEPVDGQDEAAAGLTDGLAAAGVGAGLCAGPALLDCRTYNP